MNWIDQIALGLIDTYHTNDPYELCDLLNIKIIKVDHNNIMLQGDPSLYIRDYFGKEVIFIRNDLIKNHELFYLCHELGHAVLHINITNSLNKHLINIPKLEKQADYFALKLSQIELDEIELCEMTIDQIASCLEVPVRALGQLVSL
ncbi:ImmA/IrrE family metallo-endopeptidase [Clostridium cochlearium]|uniref:ImmA/IrrE family metallo-endopeptidase n=1 Tax=Clostridium cochlearium TaxID=1494 RepID=UPI001C0F0207|nr:ImmA/IrrE family metallo-endopeptidase [Clostridium cochlearium]MBU5269438.1 ImmA/IrrE family metallo-endopeptidase [Clostridium cochlearium]